MAQERRFRQCLITGAAHRIGRSVALEMATDAAAVIIHYQRSRSDAESLAKEIMRMGAKASTIAADLSSPSEAEGLMGRAWEGGPVDVLINNASIFEAGRLTDVTVDDLQRNLMVNAFAPLLLSRVFAELNAARETASRPVIINMLDARVGEWDGDYAAYRLAKRMLWGLTRITALEFAPRIRVNGIGPGLILPPAGKDRSYIEELKGTNPLNSTGSPEQIAHAVRFLVENEFVTGQIIYVDGGRHMMGNIYG